MLVELRDSLRQIEDLSTVGLQFRSKKPDASFTPWANGESDGMLAKCLIDTSVGSWPGGKYRLYMKFDSAPEHPVVGPIVYYVIEP
jgi:hypothetical protein